MRTVVNPIVAIDLTASGPVSYPLNGNRLWIPTYVLLRDSAQASGFGLKPQNIGAVVGVQFGDQTSEMLPMGCAEALVNMFSGQFERIIVTVIVPNLGSGHSLYLYSGSDLGIGYGNASGYQPYIGLGNPGIDRA